MPTEPLPAIALPGFVFDLQHRELREVASGQRVALRPQTAAVLHCLALHAGRVVPKEELMHFVWSKIVVTDDSLVQCIKDLRRVLGDVAHRIIQTEPKRGYRMVIDAAPAADFKQDIRFASSANGIRIAYAISGVGPPLVRAAHWMTHVEWDFRSSVAGEFLRHLSQRYKLLRYDGRGCGLSDRGVQMATLDDAVRDLEAVVDAAGFSRFALLGRSQGGAIAISYAARHPDRVSHLVTVGGFLRGQSRRGEQSASTESIEAFCGVLQEGWGKENSALRQIWTSYAFPGASVEQQDSWNQLQRVACSPQDAATIWRTGALYDATAEVQRVRCPTLVLHNPDDALVPFEEGRLIAAGIKGAHLETFAGRNHVPLPGEPAFECVMAQIDKFLAVPSPTAPGALISEKFV
ncbi:alpha/beta fold hydrolase [Variovorax rhizosphaerae]|uniref:Alpha/beta fold hydrolase n=1 Tax=Variovorax rhizosphaerae TaxID=1836200 RepID=A0ABU8WLQ8_9BURK